MGAPKRDYRRKVPPNSYIHVEDFESPKHLAKYLNLLSNNDRIYKKYFEWRKHYQLLPIREDYYCRLCAFLHADPPPMWYKDLNEWYRDPDYCIKPSEDNPYGFWTIEERRNGIRPITGSLNPMVILR